MVVARTTLAQEAPARRPLRCASRDRPSWDRLPRMKIPASAAVTIVITSIASMAAAQSPALPPAASPAPAPESQPATAPASPPAWTYPHRPRAPPREPEFGDPGEYVISSTFFASFGHLGSTKGGRSTTSFSIQPSLDYFVGKNVLIGGALYFSYSDSAWGSTDTTTTALGAYVHVGGNVAVGPTVSWSRIVDRVTGARPRRSPCQSG